MRGINRRVAILEGPDFCPLETRRRQGHDRAAVPSRTLEFGGVNSIDAVEILMNSLI